MKIGIVEDDDRLREAISVYLENRGATVRQYRGYQDIVNHYEKEIELVILDVKLEDGYGINLISWLKNMNKQVKTIVITGYDSLPKRLESFTEGVDDYMKKPVFPSELFLRIQRLLKKEAVAVIQVNTETFTKLEEAFLQALLTSPGSYVTKEYLIEQLRLSTGSLYTLVSRVKSKSIGMYKIKSRYGRGWSITVL